MLKGFQYSINRYNLTCKARKIVTLDAQEIPGTLCKLFVKTLAKENHNLFQQNL